jgi:hypothetical protein
MVVPFPTRPTGGQGRRVVAGFPLEADACPCGDHRLVVDDECLWCGLLPGYRIREIWARRAAQVGTGEAVAA